MAGWEPRRAPLRSVVTGRVAHVSDEATDRDDTGQDWDETDSAGTQVDDAQQALEQARRRLSEVPAQVVVVNHVMGLYELAAIHLGATPPRLGDAALAIDAVGCLVEGLEDRLGEEQATLRDALGNIRVAFVQIKNAAAES